MNNCSTCSTKKVEIIRIMFTYKVQVLVLVLRALNGFDGFSIIIDHRDTKVALAPVTVKVLIVDLLKCSGACNDLVLDVVM